VKKNKKIDLGEYLFTGNKKSTRVNLGVHTLAQSSLVMEGFHRRGVSANTSFESLNSSVAGFVMRTQEIIGFKKGLGLSDSGNIVNGVVWESQPIKENPEKLYVSATYVSGKSNTSGDTVGEGSNTQDGDAMSLIADSTLLNQQLRLRGEVASSNIDFVTADTNDSDINDSGDAVSLLATYTPQSSNENSQFFWNSGLEFSKVGSTFISLANPFLANDKKLNRLFFNADYKGISSQFSTASELDNIDNNGEQPQIETQLTQLTLNYSLTEQPKENSFFDNIGTPSFSLMWSNTNQEQVKESTVFIFDDLDISNDNVTLSANFNKANWSWAWSFSEMEQDNKINPDQNSITWSRSLNANYRLNEHITFTPSLQSQATASVFDNTNIDTDIFSMSTQLFFSEKITGSINLNQSDSKTESLSSTGSEIITTSISTQFTWNWILPKNNKPGFDIGLTASYVDSENKFNSTGNLETYQVFLSLTMKLPLSSAEK
jgi:hypothetical protein